MEKAKNVESYYAEEHPFKSAIGTLRRLAQQTEAEETCKWGMPVYTIKNKNVFGICRFKSHFGVWFFNGAFMDDPKKVLENAQEGKTKGMRHWKFESEGEIHASDVLDYMKEAIQKQKEGKVLETKKSTTTATVPELLQEALDANPDLGAAFTAFTPYKQKEFSEYISEAKQEKTKMKRLEKILPLIAQGKGLDDAYR